MAGTASEQKQLWTVAAPQRLVWTRHQTNNRTSPWFYRSTYNWLTFFIFQSNILLKSCYYIVNKTSPETSLGSRMQTQCNSDIMIEVSLKLSFSGAQGIFYLFIYFYKHCTSENNLLEFLYYATFTVCFQRIITINLQPVCISQKWENCLFCVELLWVHLCFKCSKGPYCVIFALFGKVNVSSSCHWTDNPWEKRLKLFRTWMELITHCYASNGSN